jgi:protease-4
MHILKRITLNSVADKIYINPVGEMDFKGLPQKSKCFTKVYKKNCVKWKSFATENTKVPLNLSENEMSAANREQVTALLNSVWNSVTADI